MTPLTDDEVRWLVNSHTCSLEMVGDTCRVCWLGNERAALLAERDALKDSLAMEREQVEIGATARNELHNEVQAYMKEKRAEIDALKAELAALREKAERLHGALVTFNWNGDDICRVCWGWRTHKETHHAPGCPAAPDFLTTSATESRGAKGGEQC